MELPFDLFKRKLFLFMLIGFRGVSLNVPHTFKINLKIIFF